MKLNKGFLAKAAGKDCISEPVAEQLDRYASLIYAANQKINLVSRSTNIETEIERQIALSLILTRLFTSPPGSWIDIGSGGGFPVAPLAIVWKATGFTAVEPVAKKAYFLERTVQDLKLDNLKIRAARIQDIIDLESTSPRDVVSVKAVTDLSSSLRWARNLLATNGKFVTYKPEKLSRGDLEILEKLGFEGSESLNVKELIDSIDLQVITCNKL